MLLYGVKSQSSNVFSITETPYEPVKFGFWPATCTKGIYGELGTGCLQKTFARKVFGFYGIQLFYNLLIN